MILNILLLEIFILRDVKNQIALLVVSQIITNFINLTIISAYLFLIIVVVHRRKSFTLFFVTFVIFFYIGQSLNLKKRLYKHINDI